MSIHWHGAAQDYVLLLWLLLLYMVKFKIIACHPTTLGWLDWRFDGDYDGYDSVGKAVDVCRKQQESFPEPWQFSIIVVEFDCHVWVGERLWMSDLTSEKPKIAGRIPIWGDVNAEQIFFLSGCRLGTPPGFDRPSYEY